MSPTPFAWSNRSSGIPFDVTFQIAEKNGRKIRLCEVKAHKWLLAMVSDIFKTMFYATNVGDKAENVIKIEKTTASAFQIMIDSVYNAKSIEESLAGKSIHEIFDVVNLVERYQIPELKEAIQQLLAEYPITEHTVLEVAEEAMEYVNMFKDEANDLLLNCAKFLKSQFKDLNSVYTYAAANKEHKEVFATLLALVQDVTPSECPNCKSETCKDGEEVKNEEFREGLVVTNKKLDGGWGKWDYGTGRVTKVENKYVTLESIKQGRYGVKFNDSYGKTYKSKPDFLFSCK